MSRIMIMDNFITREYGDLTVIVKSGLKREDR